jgi:hypothetical protein
VERCCRGDRAEQLSACAQLCTTYLRGMGRRGLRVPVDSRIPPMKGVPAAPSSPRDADRRRRLEAAAAAAPAQLGGTDDRDVPDLARDPGAAAIVVAPMTMPATMLWDALMYRT